MKRLTMAGLVLLVFAGLSWAGISVTSYGAAGRVSGSLHCVDVDGYKVLVDCGGFIDEETDTPADMESRSPAATGSERLPPSAMGAGSVILTHAHLDHSGRLPLLIERGWKGTVFCSSFTATLSRELLIMDVRYDEVPRTWSFSKRSIKKRSGKEVVTAHWRKDCSWRSQIKASNLRHISGTIRALEKKGVIIAPCAQCAETSLAPVFARFKVCERDRPYRLTRNLSFTLCDSGHMPGADYVVLRSSGASGSRTLVFSGDLGNGISRMNPRPGAAPAADAVWVESTYGGVARSTAAADEFAAFRAEVGRAASGGGIVWIPAFAVDRVQKILLEIKAAQDEGLLSPDIPVICPSPLAGRVTAIYEAEAAHPGAEKVFLDSLYALRTIIPRNYTAKYYSRKPPPAPCILITTGGALERGLSRELAPKLLPDPRVTVLFTGYQAPGSIGGRLKNGARQVAVGGRPVEVAAAVRSYQCFSGHADLGDAGRWLALQSPETRIFAVHGSPAALIGMKQAIEGRGFRRVTVARPAEIYRIAQ